MNHRFDLLAEPWLPCVDQHGRPVSLGLAAVLSRCGELRALRDPSPLVTGGLLRLLLAVLHDALEGPAGNRQRARWWAAGRFDTAALDEYLSRWADRFELFSAEHPFWQDAGFALDTADPIGRLAPQVASGNNPTLFDHTVDARPVAVTPDVAARWLVANQVYGLGGGQGPTSAKWGKHPYACHAPAAVGANLFLSGDSLFETLVLNLVPASARQAPLDEPGQPLWRRDGCGQPQRRVPDGYLDYLTWPSRCIRLLPEEQDGRSVVRQAYVAQGCALPTDLPVRDPFHPMRPADGGSRPLRVNADRSLWRDSAVLFGLSSAAATKQVAAVPRPFVLQAGSGLLGELEDPPVSFDAMVVGLDFDQSKVVLWRLEELPLPAALLCDEQAVGQLTAAVAQAETVGQQLRAALFVMACRLLQPDETSEHQPDRHAAGRLADGWHAMPIYWSLLDAPYRSLVRGLSVERSAAVRAWQQALVAGADQALAQAVAHLGHDDRALKAQVVARSMLVGRTWALREAREEVTVER